LGEELSALFGSIEKFATLQVENSVVDGAEIYLLRNPSPDFFTYYTNKRNELLQPFFRKPI